MTTTIRDDECGTEPTPLLMALELGRYQWSVGFTTGMGQRPRRRVLRSEHWARLADEIVAAKRRFGLNAADTDRRRVTATPDFADGTQLTAVDVAPRGEDTGVLATVKTSRASLAAGAVLTIAPRARRGALIGATSETCARITGDRQGLTRTVLIEGCPRDARRSPGLDPPRALPGVAAMDRRRRAYR